MFTIEVQNFYTRCGVREKGKEFHDTILNLIPKEEKNIRFDFKGVQFVSSSFLDESIFTLLDNFNVSIYVRNTGIEEKASHLLSWRKMKYQFDKKGGILRFSAF